MNSEKEQVRITVYVEKEKHKKLRAKLILRGKSVSGWFRELVEKEIKV